MMCCPICRQYETITRSGHFPLHRIANKDRWTFCPFSGEPVPASQAVA